MNQYAIEWPLLDRPGAAAIRCANLAAYLHRGSPPRLALIGEAPSAHGARFSGIAFTDERSLRPHQRTSTKSLISEGFREYSATILRQALAMAAIDLDDVVLWNAVPFHPARPDDPLRNRRPSSDELALGSTWLEQFLTLVQPELVVAVGCTAARALPLGTPVVRHPAFGGLPKLTSGLLALRARL